ncbi:MAG: sugar transferase [Bacteroidia bacterium]|nr:sugar transferase [Bacteroidia bacterium]HQU99609.1 sugar transferase [Bacteroidia bacterium]
MDITVAMLLLFLLWPLFLIIAILIKLNSKGPVYFKQIRVGLNEQHFKIYKFRTMFLKAEQEGQLTVGGRDARITNVGYYLRKYKLDELPQLMNVFLGHMSLVGPRPEVPYYVSFYSEMQRKVFSIRPGITDNASIAFTNENDLLAQAKNPEWEYINVIMPAKLAINLQYIEHHNLWVDLKIIYRTVAKVWM